MTKLSPAQIRLLLQVGDSIDGLTADNASQRRIAAALAKRGHLVAHDQLDGTHRFCLTDAGRAALGRREPEADPPLPPTKVRRLVQLMSRPTGATIADMMAATGWQAHSVRGAIAGGIKKGLALGVLSEKAEGGRVYRIIAEVAE